MNDSKITLNNLHCPICEKETVKFYRKVYDDRYGYPGVYYLFQCKYCDHIFLNTKFNDDTITDLYTNYYPRSSFNINDFKPAQPIKGLGSWLRGKRFLAYTHVPENVNILDIGCGLGSTIAYHKNRGCNAFGSEVDRNVALIAEKYNLNITLGQYDSDNFEQNYFDYITMDQLIEHVENPIELLADVYNNIKKGGKVIISTPNVHGWGVKVYQGKWLHFHAPYHLHFFSKRSMKIAATKANLRVIKIRNITLSDWLYWQWIHLLFIPKPGQMNLFWKYMNPEMYTDTQKKQLKKITILRKWRINDIITRIADIIHIGDNYVFELTKDK